jgi:chitodextrinase
MALQAAALCLFTTAQADKIKENGIWTGSELDWYDTVNKIGVTNGVPYSNDDDMTRRIESPLPKDGDVSDYDNGTYANVERVKSVLPESKWDEIFPNALDIYEYDGFLRAIAKFPKFCGETNLKIGSKTYTDDEACERELAVLFAHFKQETTSLQHITEWKCTEPQPNAGTSSCDYKSYSWVS